MANAKNLAALAGLAGLAYAMRNKGNKDDAGDQKTSSYAGADTRTKVTEEEPRRQMTDYMKKAPLDGTEMYPSGVMGGAKMANDVKPAKPLASKPAASRKAPSIEDSMKNYKPRYTPSAMAPKTTEGATYGKKAYMPEDVDMSIGQKRGGMVKKMASGGMTASSRADGIASKGKTRGKIC
jgi:hypothetical protein